ncbi:AraC family transcriptional regulator [Mangrovibacterium marinum]|uniref:AraC-like DNA-binding protein n=1 Tax=Mangrovibacterium marinum TaxID=1639118 RepID=A0A2T5C1F3_9BACT|nr:AraC family transcriptional regulator [Mangrovibacterium marinum]PTN08499.1 AraC-like DNA-binding protein [Mangrovibacterium marinum]
MKPIDAENPKYCHNEFSPDKSFIYDHVHIRADEQITFHQSIDWELSYIIKGSGTRLIGEQMTTFKSGEIILIPPHLPHGWYFNNYDQDDQGKIENITILFPEALLNRLGGQFPEAARDVLQIKKNHDAICFEGETRNQLQHILVAMQQKTDLEQLSYFLKIVDLIASSKQSAVVGSAVRQNKSEAKIREVYRFMITNYQRTISLNEVAQHIGMNRSSFCSFYKREKGKSFFAGLNEYRIDCSCMMLRETSMPIADICYTTGFNDVPHFNRTFKRLKGQTPNAYRHQKA